MTIANDTVAGVPVRRITPLTVPAANADKVLLDLHGGGFDSDSGSYTETIPIAYYTQIPVVAALYRLAPEHPYPAAVDDAVAVYRELLKTHKPEQIAIYGTSAGAILAGEVASRLKQLSLPEPAALGIFSGIGDFARSGDSVHLYALRGLSGYLATPRRGAAAVAVCGADGSEGSGAFAYLRRPEGDAADTVCDQWTGPAAKRDDKPSSGLSARGGRCPADGLRWAAACVLVRPGTAGSH